MNKSETSKAEKTGARILSIETSCDETALSILQGSGDLSSPKIKILGTALYSQIEKHKEFGGVYPSLAKREHAKNLTPLLEELLNQINIESDSATEPSSNTEISKESIDATAEILEREPGLHDSLISLLQKTSRPNIDAIAVTTGPGLEPALWVGVNFARALSLIWNIPLIPVNHMEGHIVSVLNAVTDEDHDGNTDVNIDFPAIALLISGGHTQIVRVNSWGEYEIMGSTLDDAIGEAFDKVARLLGLPYPGGPEIQKLSKEIRDKVKSGEINYEEKFGLPRPMIHTKDYDFSYSGLKTAVLYLVKNMKEEKGLGPDEQLSHEDMTKIAYEFENAAVDVLLTKTRKAIEEIGARSLIIGGGVIANPYIRESFLNFVENGLEVFLPEKSLATDNAVMIGIAGFLKALKEADGDVTKFEIAPNIKANGNFKIGS
jgi:N6-L-threonylcarbamoyladenine synthase